MSHGKSPARDALYARILVPIDGSPTAQRGLDQAIALAHRLGSRLWILNVVDARRLLAEVSARPPDRLLADWRATGEKLVSESVDSACARGVDAGGVVRCDPALRICDTIVQEAKDAAADLIVMGTHGRSGLRRVALGSDAELVLRESPLPVLLVRDPMPARAD
jgi:nucleotide-binding universal stress UspA family protein